MLLLFTTLQAQSTKTFFNDADVFFKTYVKNGRVDYKSIKANPAKLDALVESVKSINVSTSNKNEYQAFWINTYNILVIKGVVDNYPVKQMLAINGFFDKTKYSAGGKNVTLNGIENNLLRAKFPKESRFHFVLVCGGLGCPPIISKAYKPSTLESQLQRQTTIALNNANFIKVKGKKVQISQIFEWYKGDFTHGGNLVDYINKYRKEPLDPKTKLSYYTYNWTLNELR